MQHGIRWDASFLVLFDPPFDPHSIKKNNKTHDSQSPNINHKQKKTGTSNEWELIDIQRLLGSQFSEEEIPLKDAVRFSRNIPGFIRIPSVGSKIVEPVSKMPHSLPSAPSRPLCNTCGILTTFVSKNHFAIIGNRSGNFRASLLSPSFSRSF